MGRTTNLKTSLIMAVFLMAMACTAAGDVIYVDDDASLGGNGQNWATPYRYLQDALKMQANYTHSGEFYREGIGALSHNNKHPERVLLRDFKY